MFYTSTKFVACCWLGAYLKDSTLIVTAGQQFLPVEIVCCTATAAIAIAPAEAPAPWPDGDGASDPDWSAAAAAVGESCMLLLSYCRCNGEPDGLPML